MAENLQLFCLVLPLIAELSGLSLGRILFRFPRRPAVLRLRPLPLEGGFFSLLPLQESQPGLGLEIFVITWLEVLHHQAGLVRLL